MQPPFKYLLFTHRVSACKLYYTIVYRNRPRKMLKQCVKCACPIAAKNFPFANSAVRRVRGNGSHLLVKALGNYVT